MYYEGRYVSDCITRLRCAFLMHALKPWGNHSYFDTCINVPLKQMCVPYQQGEVLSNISVVKKVGFRDIQLIQV